MNNKENLNKEQEDNSLTVKWKDNPKLYNQLWREKNKEILKIKQREYHQSHPIIDRTKVNEYQRLWRKNNPEKSKYKPYSQTHPEKFKAYQKIYRKTNKEHYDKMRKAWDEKNKEKIKLGAKVWRENHKDYLRTHPNYKLSKKKWSDNHKEYYKQYAENHNEKLIEYRKQYYQNNKERLSRINKEYNFKHKTTLDEQKKLYRQKDKHRWKEYAKQYYLLNKGKVPREIINERQREWRTKNPNKRHEQYLRFKQLHPDYVRPRLWEKQHKDRALAYARKNRQKINERNKRNKEHMDIMRRAWYVRNKETILSKSKHKRDTDVNFKLSISFRHSIRRVLHLKKKEYLKKDLRSLQILGCDIPTFKKHLESHFTEGMSWDKVLSGEIHLDHHVPCAYFMKQPEFDLKMCFHYLNIRPLWSVDNRSKRDKLPPNHVEHLAFLRREVYGESLEVIA